uniref:tetraspanin-18-like n=1 Tax=Pristiophorus japonicus TaxID=55135 RepID=UPI00398F02F5
MGSFERIRNMTMVFNVLVSVSGCLLLVLALLLLIPPTGPRYAVSLSTVIFIGVIYAIGLSVVLLILGILGSVAAFRENRTLLMVLFLLILLVFMVELVAGIVAFLFRDQLTKEQFKDELIDYYTGDNATDYFSSDANSIMITFECCGVAGPNDFTDALEFLILNPSYNVPEACCNRTKATSDGEILDLNKCVKGNVDFIHAQGCFDLIAGQVETYLYLTGGLSIWILIMEIFVMIFTIWLYQIA